MSSTRRASKGSPFRQERFASAPEFERGLMANLVAKRCAILDRTEDRQLIWFLQLLSHQNGGIKNLAAELLRKYPDRIATSSMQKFGIKSNKVYSAAQVRAVRAEMGSGSFPLKGEVQEANDLDALHLLSGDCERQKAVEAALRHEAQSFPLSYAASVFLSECKAAADSGLETHLMAICLDPALPVSDGAPWYFPTLISALREFQAEWIGARQPQVVTSVGDTLCSALEYAGTRRKMVVADGAARIGKSFAAKTWCNLNPGSARYMECPASNDDFSFFRELALSLGVSVNLKSKAQELRSRVEEVLRAGDLTLVIDEAHYLWPQSHFRNTTPGRINWIMTALVNHGVGVALVTTPQFFRSLSAIERVTCWTSDQFKGRIGRYVALPVVLSRDELEELAAVLLPAADSNSIRAAARYAESSGKYLGALEAITDVAKYFCESDGREKVEFKDVEQAIRESVTPSDEALKAALASATEVKRRRVSKVVSAPPQPDFERGATPLPTDGFRARDTAPPRQVKPEMLPG